MSGVSVDMAARTKTTARAVLVTAFCALSLPGCSGGEPERAIEDDFRAFLDGYVREIERRNSEYLLEVHPDLPAEMHEFFLDATLNMMQHADEQGLEASIECREYNVCTVTWPQPGDSWAAQTFIRHEGEWRFLPD